MTQIILTDVDETVLRFAEPFEQWMKTQGFIAQYPVRDVHHIDKAFNISNDAILSHINNFCTKDRMATLPAEPDAEEELPVLYNMGYRFIAISACLDDPEIVEARTNNLTKAFGFQWDEIHCVGLNGSKTDLLHQYTKVSNIWVEDNITHAETGYELGYDSFLLTRQYNMMTPFSGYRVNSWHEIKNKIVSTEYGSKSN